LKFDYTQWRAEASLSVFEGVIGDDTLTNVHRGQLSILNSRSFGETLLFFSIDDDHSLILTSQVNSLGSNEEREDRSR
jgi:hypothetical protein